jgi:nucleoside 2-deoxyribosyltransferase
MGHTITSTWLEEHVTKPEGMSEEIFEHKMAIKDLQEVAMADCLILDVENPSRTAGKMIETGFALAKHKLVYVVGTPPAHSIFLSLADGHFETWQHLFDYFSEVHNG